MNNALFGKTMENLRKDRVINLPQQTFFMENLLAIKMKKTEILMKKPAYLGLSMPELNKILMYEFWYYFIKPKYGKKAKLCYLGTDSFIVYIKTDNIYRNIADDVETRFVISNYELECNSIERPLRKGKK